LRHVRGRRAVMHFPDFVYRTSVVQHVRWSCLPRR
jgi:hypothetical protein